MGISDWENAFYTPNAEGDFEFSVESGVLSITKYSGPDARVYLPKQYRGQAVLAINSRAFFRCEHIEEIYIPEGYLAIGDEAFFDCKHLCEVSMPDTLEVIGKSAFSGCYQLVDIYIPKNVGEIGQNAFYGCNGYQMLTVIPDENGGPNKTQEVYISPSAIVSEDNPKYYSDGNCIITKSGTVIVGFNSSFIPKNRGIKRIAANAFENCTSLESVIIPEGVLEIGQGAFSGCTSLRELSLPDSLKRIERSAFFHCESLSEVVLPRGVECLSEDVFLGCRRLKQLKLSERIIDISPGALAQCTALKQLELADENSKYYYKDGCIIERESGTLIAGVGDCVIPSDGSIRKIGKGAFKLNDIITELDLPEGIEEIGESAFAQMKNLTSLKLPSTLRTIDKFAFSQNRSLLSVDFQSDYIEFGASAFLDCVRLNEVEYPRKTRVIDIEFNMCASLRRIVLPNTVSQIKDNTMVGLAKPLVIKFMGTAEQWSHVKYSMLWKLMRHSEGVVVECIDKIIAI